MKRLMKNKKLTAIVAAAVLTSTVFTGCNMGMADFSNESSESESSTVTTDSSRAAKPSNDSEKIDEIYKKVTEDKWEYKGEKIAVTRLLNELSSNIPTDQIENEYVRYIAESGIRALEAGAQCLDAYLNDLTCGLFGVVTNIFWPESEDGMSPDTHIILDKIEEVEKQIEEQSNLIKNCTTEILDKQQATMDLILTQDEKNYLSQRLTSLVAMKGITTDKFLAAYMSKVGNNNVTFNEYKIFMDQLTGNTAMQGSVQDPMTNVSNFFNQYVTTIKDNSYPEICSKYARNTNAWGYEYDRAMKDFAKTELVISVQLMDILKAAYCPFLEKGQVNYNYEIMRLLTCVKSTMGNDFYKNMISMMNNQMTSEQYDLYTFEYNNKVVTPSVIAASLTDSKQLYEYLIAFLCRESKTEDYKGPNGIFPADYIKVVLGDMDITKLDGVNGKFVNETEDAATRMSNLKTYLKYRNSSYDNWNTFVELYNSYVSEVENIYTKLVNDKIGYVTCMIPGVERTFTTLMGHVRFGYRTAEQLALPAWNEDRNNWSSRLYHGQDIKRSPYGTFWHEYPGKEFVDKYDGNLYNAADKEKLKNNVFEYLTEDEYKKIYNFYHLNNNKLYRSVPVFVVDDNNNILRIEKDYTADVIKNPTLTEIFYYGAGIGFHYTELLEYAGGNNWIRKWTPSTKADKSLVNLDYEADPFVIHKRDSKSIMKEWVTEGGKCPAPKDTTDLFEVAKRYAFEEGSPEAVKTQDMGNRTQYKIVSYALDGTLKDSWIDNAKKENKIVWQLENPRSGLTRVEDVCQTEEGYASWSLYGGNPTYVFPSVVHDMGWETYWDKMD